jgi:mRNA-degrading endonuclease RelE of RelBE toxin-antitoxin system
MPRRVEIEADDTAAAVQARLWYAAPDADLARNFLAELDSAIEVVADRPDRWPAGRRDTHQYRLRRFPFRVVYLFDAERVRIIAIAHNRRKPAYWANRI